MDGVHHQDIARCWISKDRGTCRHHCAHPLMDALNVKGTVRISFGIYNNMDDVDKLIAAIEKAVDML